MNTNALNQHAGSISLTSDVTHERNTAASYSAQSSMQSGLEEEKNKIQLMLQGKVW